MHVTQALRATAAIVTVALASACTNAGATDPVTPDPSAPSGATVTITTAQGDAQIHAEPTRVVVFEHGILDTIDALGFADAVVGIPHHVIPSSLAHFTQTTTNTGTLFEPDYEAINALDPDLIIVGGRSAATLPDMEAIAPTIDLSYDWEDVMGSVEANTVAIGTIFGDTEGAQARVDDLRHTIADTADSLHDVGTALVIMTVGGDISAYGPGSRFGFVYDEFGLSPAADQVAIADHGDTISFEFIAHVNPDVLIVLDRDTAVGEGSGAVAAQLLDNDLVNSTTAVKNNAVVYVNTEAWYLAFGGVQAMATITADLASLS